MRARSASSGEALTRRIFLGASAESYATTLEVTLCAEFCAGKIALTLFFRRAHPGAGKRIWDGGRRSSTFS